MIRNLDEVPPLERLALIDMSYSRINTYEMCPAKYYYSYILKEPQIFSAPAVLGNIVHDVLEDHAGEELVLSEMAVTFEQYRAIYDPDLQIDVELIDVAYVMMAEYVDRHADDVGAVQVIAKELDFSIVIGNAIMRGYIDRVDRLNEKALHIIDYKTGKYEETKVKNNLQLGIYVLACSHMFPEVDTFKAELYYLRSGRRKGHTFTRDDVPMLEQRVLDALNAIINDQHFSVTKNIRICGFCEHATSETCAYGVSQRKRLRRY